MEEQTTLNFDKKCDFIKEFILNITQLKLTHSKELRTVLLQLISVFKTRQLQAKRTREKFLAQNHQWLEKSISFPVTTTETKQRGGRPEVGFEEVAIVRKGERQRHCESYKSY